MSYLRENLGDAFCASDFEAAKRAAQSMTEQLGAAIGRYIERQFDGNTRHCYVECWITNCVQVYAMNQKLIGDGSSSERATQLMALFDNNERR